MPQDSYSDDDAEAILRLASRSVDGGATSRERLIQMANELGITEEALTSAENDYRRVRIDESDLVLFERHRRGDVLSKVGGYLWSTLTCLGINFFLAHSITWAWWVLFGCAIGLANTLKETFFLTAAEKEKSFRKWQRKQRKREAIATGSADISGADSEEEAVYEMGRKSRRLRISEIDVRVKSR